MKWSESDPTNSVNENGQWPILRVARAIILSADKKDFLIVYRAGSHFNKQGENAGGKIESEDVCAQLRRELQEELALHEEDYLFPPQEPFLDFMRFDPLHPHTPNTPYKNKLILTYTYQITLRSDATIQLSPEHSKLKWCRVSDLHAEENITPYTRSALAAWQKNNGRVTFSSLAGQENKMLNPVTYPNFSHASPNQGANR